jgi:hypothetical protein
MKSAQLVKSVEELEKSIRDENLRLMKQIFGEDFAAHKERTLKLFRNKNTQPDRPIPA